MYRTLTYLLLLGFVGPLLMAADCDHAAPATTTGFLVMDARNGAVTGPTNYKRGQAIQLLLVNKNPLRYQYTVDIKGKPVTETAIGEFFALAGIKKTSDEAPASAPGDSTGAAHVLESIRSPLVGCAPQLRQDFKTGRDALVAAKDDLEAALDAAVGTYETVVADVKAKREAAQAPDLEGPAACQAAVDLIAAASFNLDVDSIKAKMKVLDRAIDAHEQNVDDVADCADEDAVAAFQKELRGAAKALRTAGEKLDELIAAKKSLDQDAKKVQAAIRKANAFWESYPIGPYSGRMDVTVAVSRKDLTVDGATAEALRPEPLELNFGGGQRFFLSGGIVASVSDRKTFDAVDGFVLDRDGKLVLDGDGKPTFGKVVGVTEESDSRVAPAVLLHGLVWQPDTWCDGVGLALGVGSAGGDEKLIEYFGGPTFSFIEHHLFITVGAFRGVDEKLGGDFYVGAAIPSTVTTLPKVERRAWTPGISISFRMP